jgi:sugar lactone lactonase YvrE
MTRRLEAFGPPARFYECPRWRDGRWWVSDMRGDAVHSFSAAGEPRVELNLERPAGLGWTPDGRLLVVSMDAQRLARVAPTGEVEATFDLASLAGETAGFLNDMVVTQDGHAYVGFDADFNRYGTDAELGMILHVDPKGQARVAARGLAFPNGLVLTPDGATLVVAETMKPRLTSFALGPDGALGERKVWASLGPRRDARPAPHPPLGDAAVSLDGCAMDAEGHIWAADVRSACLRIAPGGAIVDAVFLPEPMHAFACALGGADGRTLMICGADDDFGDRAGRLSSQLYVTRVDVPAA